MPQVLSQAKLNQSLSVTDLTNLPNQAHAMQLLLNDIHSALAASWRCQRQTVRASPVVPVSDNYDRLGYPEQGAAREARYSRYISDHYMLRTQTSAAIPNTLAGLNDDPPEDLLLILPGLVYRRDCIDRLHCAEPHQLDLWRIVDGRKKVPMSMDDLKQMITIVMYASLPGIPWQLMESPHPYTEQGVQIDALWQDEWVEVGECGLIAPEILQNASLATHTGLAMGLGLDRLLMIRKNIPDIRLLRSADPRVTDQMGDLMPYQPISMMPAITRDLSVSLDAAFNVEDIGDLVRNQLPDCSAAIEALIIKSETPYDKLPPTAHRRMGMRPEQKNVLLRLVIRDMARTLTDPEANAIRNEVYNLLHEGDNKETAKDG